MDTFHVECNHCGADIQFSVKDHSPVKKFTCPGCGRILTTSGHEQGALFPTPQTDISQSPAPQARVLNFRRGSEAEGS